MSAKVVTVMNMKGGVGKTTVTAHIGGMIARSSYFDKPVRVLLIDYDPQFNLSQTYLPSKTYFAREKAKKTILQVLVENEEDLDHFRIHVPGSSTPPSVVDLAINVFKDSKGNVVDLVPSTLDLMYIALGRSDKSLAPIKDRFAAFVAEARRKYDFVLLDCHPAGSIFTDTSIKSSDYVLIPVARSKYAIRGVGLMEKFLDAKAQQPKLGVQILFNDVPRVGTDKVENDIRSSKYGKLCMSQTLKHYKAFSDPQEGADFVWDSTKAWSTSAWINLYSVTREFLKGVGA